MRDDQISTLMLFILKALTEGALTYEDLQAKAENEGMHAAAKFLRVRVVSLLKAQMIGVDGDWFYLTRRGYTAAQQEQKDVGRAVERVR